MEKLPDNFLTKLGFNKRVYKRTDAVAVPRWSWKIFKMLYIGIKSKNNIASSDLCA